MRRLLALVGAIVFVDTMFFAALTPLLPGYEEELGLGKVGAGVLAAAYPAGALVGGLPSGLAVGRFGARATAVAGLVIMSGTTVTFGLAESVWLLDTARFVQGIASACAWTAGLSWLVSAAPANRRGTLIGSAMAMAIGGALFGPVVGGIASLVGPEPAFGAVGALALLLAVYATVTTAPPAPTSQPISMLGRALRDRRIVGGVWFVMLPALLFGTLSVLAPLRLDELGFGAVAISATYLVMASCEAAANPLLGRYSDRRGRLKPIRFALVGSTAAAALLPWPDQRFVLATVVIAAGIVFGSFWTPAMSFLADVSEARGLEYGLAFALINMAWAPGHALGSAAGAGLASLTADSVPYLTLSALCLLTFAALWRSTSSS